MGSDRAERHPPQPPETATARGVLRPVGWAVLAVVLGLLVIAAGVWIADALPDPELREPIHRFVIENRTEGTLARIELTDRTRLEDGAPVVLDATTDVPHGGRWIVERGLGEVSAVGLVVDEADVRYEFHRVANARADLGDVHVVTIRPGPRVHGRDADVTGER